MKTYTLVFLITLFPYFKVIGQTLPEASTYQWTKLIDSESMPIANMYFQSYSFDRVNRKIHVLYPTKIYSLDVETLTFNSVDVSGVLSNQLGQQIFNPDLDAIQFWRAGPDKVYQVPIGGGNALQIAEGNYSAEHYGATALYNGVTSKPATLFGYGFYKVRNSMEELGSNGWVTKNPNSLSEPFRRSSSALLPNHDFSKAYIIDGHGNPSGNQSEKSCPISTQKNWANDVGVYCWLSDIWEIDLSNWTFKNILPVASDFKVTSRFGYDYDNDTFFSFGGYTPMPVYGQAAVHQDSLRIFKPGETNGWITVEQIGDIPSSTIQLTSYYDSQNKRFILAGAAGVWELKEVSQVLENPIIDLNRDLIAYYPFDGNADNAIESGLTTILNTATPGLDRFRQLNSAYSLNGVDQRLQVSGISGSFNEGTVSVWMNLSDQSDLTNNPQVIGFYKPDHILQIEIHPEYRIYYNAPEEYLESWNLTASLRMAGQPSAAAILGTSHLATDGFDEGLDLALPPPPPVQTLRAWFSRPDWGLPLGTDFSSDIRAVRDLTTQVQRWTLSVRSELGGELTLRLAPPGAGTGLPLSVRVDGLEASGMDSLSVVFQAQAGVTYAVLIEVGDLTAPVVRLAADLTGPAIWQAGESRQLTWQIEEANRVSRLHLEYRTEPDGWRTLYDGADTTSVSWASGTAGEPTRRVWLRLNATDAAGNTGADSTSYPVTLVSPRQGIAFADAWFMASNPLMQASWAQQGPALRYVWQAQEYHQPQDLADAQGYWVGGYRAGADSLLGTVRSEASVLQLSAGWNLTGSGLMLDVLIDSVMVTHGGHGRTLHLPQAVDSSWVTAPLTYDGAAYGSSEVFTPAKGYWVGVSVPQGATLTLPIHRQDRPASKQPAESEPGLWFTLRDGVTEHRLGVSLNRAVATPPAAPNSQRVGLLGPASALGSLYLQAKADPDSESAWPLVIGGEARTVELSWTDQDFAGMSAMLALSDRRYDLTRANTLSLRTDESAHIVVGSMTTSVVDDFQNPLRTDLLQAYPNPFNPTTVIGYELSVSGSVRLAVYDLLGREVAVLVNGNMPTGSHKVMFDASSLASGVYIYRLQAGGRVFTRRMTLVK
jgi:hypothetical protein